MNYHLWIKVIENVSESRLCDDTCIKRKTKQIHEDTITIATSAQVQIVIYI